MVIGTVSIIAATPIAIGVGAGSAATAGTAGVAVAVGGGTATAGVGAAVAGAATAATNILSAAAAPLIAAGPVGWITLGKETDKKSWDCWRAVLHDLESPDSRGRLLKDVAADSRVVQVRSETQEGFWPQYWLKNQWGEEFRIDYVLLAEGEIAAHAVRI